MELDGWLVS